MKTIILILCCSLTRFAHAQDAAQVRTPVADPRPLLVAALDSTTGVAHGILTGDIADAMARSFGTRTPIFIDVRTEKRLAQAGCARLQMRFWQDAVYLPGAAVPRRQTIEFGLNYCRDGQAPRAPAGRAPS